MAGHRVILVLAALCLASSNAAPAVAHNPGKGIRSESAAQIVAAAIAAGSGAQSVHVHGGWLDHGKNVSVNLWLGPQGARGWVSVDAGAIGVVRVGADVYVQGNARFWERAGQDATAAALMTGEWIKVPRHDHAFAELEELLHLRNVLRDSLFAAGKLADPSMTTFDGELAVELTGAGNNDADVFFAATGPPYPLLAETITSPNDLGTLLFDHWNAPLTVTAPGHFGGLTHV